MLLLLLNLSLAQAQESDRNVRYSKRTEIDFEGLDDIDDIPFDEEMDRISEEMEPQNLVDDEASNDISEDKK